MSEPPADLECPRCGNEAFTSAVDFREEEMRKVFACTECGLTFDGKRWTTPAGAVFELTHGT